MKISCLETSAPSSLQVHHLILALCRYQFFVGELMRLTYQHFPMTKIERRWITIGVTEVASARTEHAMCNVGDRIYIFGGQLDLNANEDSGLIHVLETGMFIPPSL